MKIFYLTAFVPNPSAAGEKNTMLMLNDLGREHTVDLAYFKYAEFSDYTPEISNIKVVFTSRISRIIKIFNVLNFPLIYPIFSVRFNWIELFKIKKIIKKNKYDLLIFNHSQTFLYSKFLNKSIPKILISHDVISQRVRRKSSKIIQKICMFSEKKCLEGKNKYIFSSCQKDSNLIEDFYKIQSHVYNTYIDEKILNAKHQKIDSYYVLFGDWRRTDNYEGALWFLNKVLPLCQSKMRLKIIGNNFPIQDIKSTNKIHDIEILGFVVDPYIIISNSIAMISPLFTGAGIKVKVIESLACGTPVIGTVISFEGISSEFKKYMIEANTPQEYLNAINSPILGLNERISLKEKFINSNKSETLPVYIKKFFS